MNGYRLRGQQRLLSCLIAWLGFAGAGFAAEPLQEKALSPPLSQGSSLTPAPTRVYMQRRSLVTPMSEPETTIFLTFDDGPTPGVTDRIAQILAGYKIEASFFVVGRNARSPRNRAILARLAAEGHLIANHTYEHSNRYLSEAEFESSLRRTTALLADFLPQSGEVFFRSPSGIWNRMRSAWVNRSVQGGQDTEFASYIGPIFWNAGGAITRSGSSLSNAADWQCWAQQISVALCAQGYLAKIRTNAAAGKPSVVLMHDLSGQSAELLEQVLEGLLQDSNTYQFKRLDRASWPSGWPGL